MAEEFSDGNKEARFSESRTELSAESVLELIRTNLTRGGGSYAKEELEHIFNRPYEQVVELLGPYYFFRNGKQGNIILSKRTGVPQEVSKLNKVRGENRNQCPNESEESTEYVKMPDLSNDLSELIAVFAMVHDNSFFSINNAKMPKPLQSKWHASTIRDAVPELLAKGYIEQNPTQPWKIRLIK